MNLSEAIKKGYFQKSEDYLSIRMVDPETYENKKLYTVLTYLMWPSSRVIFLKKRKTKRKIKGSMIKIKPLNYIQNKKLGVEVFLFQLIMGFL